MATPPEMTCRQLASAVAAGPYRRIGWPLFAPFLGAAVNLLHHRGATCLRRRAADVDDASSGLMTLNASGTCLHAKMGAYLPPPSSAKAGQLDAHFH